MTAIRIVDASALAAIVFAEPEGEDAVARLRGAALAAPALLAYEIANVCLAKIRANPAQRQLLLTAFENWTAMGIELVEVDSRAVLMLADESGLTAYDVSYLWLARRLNAELVTYDRRLARATQAR